MNRFFFLLFISINVFSQKDTISTFNGTKYTYHENGKLKAKMTYKAGKVNGPCIFYDKEGYAVEEGFFVNKRWSGQYRLYYPGSSIVQQNFQFGEKGKREGLQRYYYRNGVVQLFSKYVNGKQEGYYLEFDSLGKLKGKPLFYENSKVSKIENKEMLEEMLEIVKKENQAALGK